MASNTHLTLVPTQPGEPFPPHSTMELVLLCQLTVKAIITINVPLFKHRSVLSGSKHAFVCSFLGGLLSAALRIN